VAGAFGLMLATVVQHRRTRKGPAVFYILAKANIKRRLKSCFMMVDLQAAEKYLPIVAKFCRLRPLNRLQSDWPL
jgi:hypothetical protein